MEMHAIKWEATGLVSTFTSFFHQMQSPVQGVHTRQARSTYNVGLMETGLG